MSPTLCIISGGQTGADRAALDWAIANRMPHGGWCPSGRKALDGPLDAKYDLRETPSSDYPQRTEWNVRDSDATVVFTLSANPSGGSMKTLSFAQKLGKPSLHLHPGLEAPAQLLAAFVQDKGVSRLNVAGSRESKEPGLYAWVQKVLNEALPTPVSAPDRLP